MTITNAPKATQRPSYKHLQLNVIRERLREDNLGIVADLDDDQLKRLRNLVRTLPILNADGTPAE